MTTQIGTKFVIQMCYQNLLIVLGLNQDFIEKNRFFIFFKDGARACQ